MKEKMKTIGITLLIILSMFVIPLYIYSFLPFISNESLRDLVANIIYLSFIIAVFNKEVVEGIKKLKTDFKKNINIGFKYWFLGLVLMVISNLIINIIIFKGSIASNEESVRQIILSNPIYGIISAVIIAPILEELILRASLRRCINKKYLYAVICGLIFGIMHIISGFSGPLDLLYIIPYGSLGFVFGIMYYETDNIFTSIIMHSLHNLMSCILIFALIG